MSHFRNQVQENEQDTPFLAAEPIIPGYSIDESRFEVNPIPYFDENMGRGLGSGDASSLFYDGSNLESGGFNSSAFVEGQDVYRDRIMGKLPSDDAALDRFSSISLPNASEDLSWGFDFTNKFPGLDYQFPPVSDSWNSAMVSQSWSTSKAVGLPESSSNSWNSTMVGQSSWSTSKAVDVPESSSQYINFQNNQPQSLVISDVGGNYMTSFPWEPTMSVNRGVNSSYSCDLQFPEYSFGNNGYFGTSLATDNCILAAPSTSLPQQHLNASLLGEGANAVDHSLQPVAINKPPAYFYNMQNFSEISPMDTSEDTEVDDPLWQDFLASKPVDGGEPISVLSPVDTGESRDHSSEENIAMSDHFDQPEEGGTVIRCRKSRARRMKGVLRPLRRCSTDVSLVKTRANKGRKEEPELLKHHGKRVKDGLMLGHDRVLARRSNKQILDSDEEYHPPVQSNFQSGRSNRGERKSNKLWTLSEITTLVNGVSEYGVGKWTAIQKTFPGSPPSRSSLDIRDKWRNLIRTSGVRLKNMKEDEFSTKYGSLQLPKSMLERICELDREHPYLRSEVKPTPSFRDDDLVDSSSE